MQQFQPGQQVQTRKALLIFIKQAGAPLVLYLDNPEEVYEELKLVISKAVASAPKMVEKQGKGPLKTLAVLDTQIAGLALQEEPVIA